VIDNGTNARLDLGGASTSAPNHRDVPPAVLEQAQAGFLSASGWIGADVHRGDDDDEEDIERGKSSTVV